MASDGTDMDVAEVDGGLSIEDACMLSLDMS